MKCTWDYKFCLSHKCKKHWNKDNLSIFENANSWISEEQQYNLPDNCISWTLNIWSTIKTQTLNILTSTRIQVSTSALLFWFCLQCALQWTLAYSVPYIKTPLVQYTMIPFAILKNQTRFLKFKTITCSLTPNVLTLAIFYIRPYRYQVSTQRIIHTYMQSGGISRSRGLFSRGYWVDKAKLDLQSDMSSINFIFYIEHTAETQEQQRN